MDTSDHNIANDDLSNTDIVELAKGSELDLLPDKSKERYKNTFASFTKWQQSKITSSFSENVFLAYFKEQSEKYKPSTLWSQYSMLKAVMNTKHNINIGNYAKLTAFLKKQTVGFKSKKSMIFSPEQLQKFLLEAPDEIYLAIKVVVIFGISGATRNNELVNLTVENVQHGENIILVKITDTKTHQEKSYTIEGKFTEIIQKYELLRPKNVKTNRYFLNYQKGKCTTQVIGTNKFAKMPKEVANFLTLPEPHQYTVHSFRRTSATIMADNGADLLTIKRLGGWKSSTVAEGYIANSVKNKRKIANIHEISPKRIATSAVDNENSDSMKENLKKNSMTFTKDQKQSPSSSTDQPQLFEFQVLPAPSLEPIKQETTRAPEVPSLHNETIFVNADPSVLIYYRDNASLAQEDPLETMQVETEPKTESVYFSEIAQDELIIKEEIIDDSALTYEKIS